MVRRTALACCGKVVTQVIEIDQVTTLCTKYPFHLIWNPTGTIANTGYVRRANGHNEASLHITEVFNITAGQTISVQTIRGGNSAPTNFRSIGTSNIYIEKIK